MRPIVYTNLFVAVCAAGMTLATYMVEARQASWSVVGFVFFATLAVYNFDRLVGSSSEDAISQTPRLAWISRNRRLLVGVTAAALLGLVICGMTIPRGAWGALVPLAVVTALYSLPAIPCGGRFIRLKDVAALKTILIALVWGMATAALPMQANVDWAFVFERIVFVFAITLPFEIRDVERDGASGIKTIPNLLGIAKTKVLAVLLLSGFVVSSLVRLEPAVGGALAISGLSTIPLVALTQVERGDYFYSVLMDGTMLLQLGLLVALNY